MLKLATAGFLYVSPLVMQACASCSRSSGAIPRDRITCHTPRASLQAPFEAFDDVDCYVCNQQTLIFMSSCHVGMRELQQVARSNSQNQNYVPYAQATPTTTLSSGNGGGLGEGNGSNNSGNGNATANANTANNDNGKNFSHPSTKSQLTHSKRLA